MARPKTSVDRLSNLRKAFQTNRGKVLSGKQVQDAVGAAYWRACIKDLKSEGMNIESVRTGRVVVGYKYVDIKDAVASTKRTEGVRAAVAASKPKKAAKGKTPAKAKPAKGKGKAAKVAPAKKQKVDEVKATVMIDETPLGEEDPDVLAILQQAGLTK